MSQDASALFESMVKTALTLLGEESKLNQARLSTVKALRGFLDAKADLAAALGRDPLSDHSACITRMRLCIQDVQAKFGELVQVSGEAFRDINPYARERKVTQ